MARLVGILFEGALAKPLLRVLCQSEWSLEALYLPDWGGSGGCPSGASTHPLSVDMAPELIYFIIISTVPAFCFPCANWPRFLLLQFSAWLDQRPLLLLDLPQCSCWELSLLALERPCCLQRTECLGQLSDAGWSVG